ncbi:ferritin-like domain-containing protein [Undibacterium arcticum]
MAFYPTRNTLPEDIRLQAVDLLGKGLITAIDVQRHAKQAHWNVHGPNFIGLHLLFDEVHGAALAWADLCAERLVALGGTADGRVEHVAKQTPLNPYPLQVKKAVPNTYSHWLPRWPHSASKCVVPLKRQRILTTPPRRI